MGEVIAKIGLEHADLPPIVLGVAEVENDQVLIDLVNNEHLLPFHYGFCHYDSPDPRGIDVAFLYQRIPNYLQIKNIPCIYTMKNKNDIIPVISYR